MHYFIDARQRSVNAEKFEKHLKELQVMCISIRWYFLSFMPPFFSDMADSSSENLTGEDPYEAGESSSVGKMTETK